MEMYDWFIDTLNKFIWISILCDRGRYTGIQLIWIISYSYILHCFLFSASPKFFPFFRLQYAPGFLFVKTFFFWISNTRLILFIHLQWTKHYERSISVYQISSGSFCLSVFFYGCTRYFLDDIWMNTFFPTIKWMNWIESLWNLNAKESQYLAVYVRAEQ